MNERTSILFYDTRESAAWCREHRKVCFVGTNGVHRHAFLLAIPKEANRE